MSKKKVKKPVVEIPAGVRMFIGIDPGASGGIVSLDAKIGGGNNWTAASMPCTYEAIWRVLSSLTIPRQAFAVLEKVGGFVAGNPTPGSAMFNFGANYGALKMALIGQKVPFVEVVPHSWQKALGIESRRKGEEKADWKRRLRDEAQKRFPKARLTLKTCDAFLLAAYARQLCEQARRESA